MAIFQRILIVLLVLLSLAAGTAKAMRMPQEVDLFQSIGLGEPIVIAFGLLQIIAALLVIPPKTRAAGLWIVAAGFMASALMIFATGNIVFGLVSLIPPILAMWLARTQASAQA